MLGRWLLTPCLLAATALVLTPGTGAAQHFLPGSVTFGGSSIFYSQSPLVPYSGGSPSYNVGTYFGYSPPTWGSYPSPYVIPFDLYSAPPHLRHRYGNPAPSEGRYGAIGGNSASPRKTEVEVRVPSANAELWFEGVKRSEKGTVRRFMSPPLSPGTRYVYTVRARWREGGREITRSRDVYFYPGDPVRVDFRNQK